MVLVLHNAAYCINFWCFNSICHMLNSCSLLMQIFTLTFWILENMYSNTLGVIPQSALCLRVPPSISPSMVCVFPLPVCTGRHRVAKYKTSIKFKSSSHCDMKIGKYFWKQILESLSYYWATYLSIGKHTTIVASHTVFHHGYSSSFKEHLLLT